MLPFRVMAPSTLGTFLRSFTFGHVRQLDAVIAEAIRRAWHVGAGPGDAPMTIDIDSTVCEVHGKQTQGAAYGYTRQLGYHPIMVTDIGSMSSAESVRNAARGPENRSPAGIPFACSNPASPNNRKCPAARRRASTALRLRSPAQARCLSNCLPDVVGDQQRRPIEGRPDGLEPDLHSRSG